MLATPFLQAEQAASHACLVPNRRDHHLDIVDKETLDAGTEQDQADSNTNYRNLLLSILEALEERLRTCTVELAASSTTSCCAGTHSQLGGNLFSLRARDNRTSALRCGWRD